MLDGLNAEGRCDMAFARAGAANQDNILGIFHELGLASKKWRVRF
jgi:hypothetical protein